MRVVTNHLLNRSEPFEKKKTVSNKNGVVGTKGKTAPKKPKPKKIKPKAIQR